MGAGWNYLKFISIVGFCTGSVESSLASTRQLLVIVVAAAVSAMYVLGVLHAVHKMNNSL
jgi:hypothetical protein